MVDNENNVKTIEKALIRLDDNFFCGGITEKSGNDDEHNLQIDVIDVGSWILKFRSNGVLINNRDIIFSELVNIDATIVYKSNNSFWEVFNGAMSIDNAITKGDAIKHGSDLAIENFQRKLNKLSASKSEDGDKTHDMNTPQKKLFSRSGITEDFGEIPLKHGWLLKKRDIFSGWRNRYFVVFSNRVEYYIDQCDIHSRATIPLTGCEIIEPKKFKLNGIPNHWYIVVDSKVAGIGKTLKLASETPGDAGFAEVFKWAQALQQAVYASTSQVQGLSMTARTSISGTSIPAFLSRSSNPAAQLSSYSQNLVNRSRNSLGVRSMKTNGNVVHDIIVEASEKISHRVEELGKTKGGNILLYSSAFVTCLAIAIAAVYKFGVLYGLTTTGVISVVLITLGFGVLKYSNQ